MSAFGGKADIHHQSHDGGGRSAHNVLSVTLPTPLARFAPSRLPPYRPGARNESTGFPESLRGFTLKKRSRIRWGVCFTRERWKPAAAATYALAYVPPLCSPSPPLNHSHRRLISTIIRSLETCEFGVDVRFSTASGSQAICPQTS